MDKKIWLLPKLTAAAGIVLSSADCILLNIYLHTARSGQMSLENLDVIYLYLRPALRIAAFVIIGMVLRNALDRETIINAAWMLIAYNVWVLLMQQIVRHFGTYELLFQLLLLPLDIFGIIPEVLLKLGIAKFSIWIAILSEFFAPLLFILFAKKR